VVVDAAIAVHKALGPGLLESAYEACLLHELRRRGLTVKAQVPFPIVYDSVELEFGYRIDLLVENTIIVELKACESIAPVHRVQLLSYLKLSRRPLGLLLNFHVAMMKDGIVRIKNGYQTNTTTENTEQKREHGGSY
jgi:GxxExxY protein